MHSVEDAATPEASAPAVLVSRPVGHFYSPIVDPAELVDRTEQLWPDQPETPGVDFNPDQPQTPGIDFNDDYHLRVLEEWFPQFISGYDYPSSSTQTDSELKGFYTKNSQFTWLDSRALLVLMRAWQPRRIIEVGSGYSSLLMADVNRRYLDGGCQITCIEPDPRPFLRKPETGIDTLIEQKVQAVPLELYRQLQAGDILFIDSSHVSKTGSDVNHLFFEVLPRLAKGVRVHVHDIFLPGEYPKKWVMTENRSWNEQYLLRALLMYSTRFRVLFGCSYAFARFPNRVIAALAHAKGHGYAGGSLWIEVV